MAEIELPEFLNIPPKLIPIITEFNKYKYFIIEGGRVSAKTQSVARILLYIAQKVQIRAVCGREVQATIDESVYTVFADLIRSHNLPFKVAKSGIKCLLHNSEFKFKGFREQGSINVKGLEGIDVLWVDEAQALTRPTLSVVIPTVRGSIDDEGESTNNCKMFFTLNRLHRDDAVMDLVGREDTLHIHIDYFDNPHCPATILDEAEKCRISDERQYRHIWLGEPAAGGDEYLFDFDKLYASLEVEPYGDTFYRQRIMGVDFAAQGNDHNVNCILDRLSVHHWEPTEFIKWHEPDTTISVGKIIHNIAVYKPDIVIVDVGGMGWNVYCDLIAARLAVPIIPFNGASTDGIDQMSDNMRADAYWILREWFQQGWLRVGNPYRYVLRQLEKIKQKFQKSGKRLIESKVEYKKDNGFSPDEADALMMAVYGAVKHLGKPATSNSERNVIKRKSGSNRRK